MTTDTTEPSAAERSAALDALRGDRRRYGDTLFKGTATASGTGILLILAAVATFLTVLSFPAITSPAADLPYGAFWSWVFPYAAGTIWAAGLAMLFAVPVAIGVALFITHYAPRRLAVGLGYVIDLLAAVPSVVFGLWGINVLAPMLQPAYVWLNTNFGDVWGLSWLFGGTVSGTGRTILTVALVLAVMVLPIITAICREVFLQTPKLHEEAALALGATRWEMIRMAVLPFARPGIISGAMLGLGRALGETMAVAMVLSATGLVSFKLLTSENPSTIAANIALAFPEAYGTNVNVLIATGLILFIVTFLVNALARWIVSRRAEFSGAN